MKILLINQYYSPDTAATGQLLTDLAEQYAMIGHDVHVLCSSRSYNRSSRVLPSSEVVNAVNIHRLRALGFGRIKFIGRICDYLSFYLLVICKVLRMEKMDLCVCLTTPPFIGIVGMLLKKFKGTDYIIWSMDLYPEIAVALGLLKRKSIINKVLKRLQRKIYSNAMSIVSLGKCMTERLVEAGADRQNIYEVHNWVPSEAVAPIEKNKSLLAAEWNLNDSIVVMYSGNLGLGHDLQTVIHSAGRLKDQGNLQFLFVGSGKAKPLLQKQAKLHDLSNVQFHRPVPLDTLSDSLAAADIHIVSQKPGTQGYIFPSKFYGILAAQRPVIYIGPDDSEIAQVIKKYQCGLQVNAGDDRNLARAIQYLSGDRRKLTEMSENARQCYLNNFTMETGIIKHCHAVRKSLARAGRNPDVFLDVSKSDTKSCTHV